MTTEINIIRGNTKTLNFSFTDNDSNAIDITGYTVWFTVRSTVPGTSVSSDDDAIISKKQLPAELTNPTNGITALELSPTDTNICPGTYKYDVQYSTNGTNRFSSSVGDFTVSGDITRE